LAPVEAELAKNPESASAIAEYSRVLMDQGQWEAAINKMQESLQIDPNAAAVKRDLYYAALHLQQTPASIPNLDDAITAARAQLNLQKAKQTSKEFFNRPA